MGALAIISEPVVPTDIAGFQGIIPTIGDGVSGCTIIRACITIYIDLYLLHF